jgi:putative flippase GtrA
MLKQQLQNFLLVGGTTAFIDFAVYKGLLLSGLTDVHTAKIIGFLSGTLFAYVANRFWTFQHNGRASKSVMRFGFLYALTLGVNVLVNGFVLQALEGFGGRVLAAFLVATGVSASLNFIGMKMFVFNTNSMAVTK